MTKGTNENPNDDTSINEDDIDPIEAFAELTRDENSDAPADQADEDDERVDEGNKTDASQDDGSPSTSDEKPDDIWAQATDSQRNEYQQAQAANVELDHRYRSSNGRISALQKQINGLQTELSQANTDPAPSKEAAIKAGLTPEQIAEFEEDYGDISTFIKGYTSDQINEAVKSQVAPFQQQMSKIEQAQQGYAEREAEDATATEYNRLAKAHPDFQTIQNDNNFWQWLDSKPAFIRNAVESKSADDNIELLNQYKRETSTAVSRTQERNDIDLSAHAELPRKGAPKIPEQEPTDPVELFNVIANS